MSGRAKRTSAAISKYVEVESDVDMDEEEKKEFAEMERRGTLSAFVAPAKKKAKKSKKKVVQMVFKPKVDETDGKLSLFVTMPVDIVSEIFNHLHLRDVLVFSRLSKMFRSLLNSELKGLWTAARLRLPLPLPTGMTEQFLATLLYGRDCFFCDSPGNQMNLNARTRTCYPCFQSQLKLKSTRSHIAKLPESQHLHPQAHLCIPHQQRPDEWNRARGFKIFVWNGQMLRLDESIEAVSDTLHALNTQSGNLAEQNQGRSARAARRGQESVGTDTMTPSIAAPLNVDLIAFVLEKCEWVNMIARETKALAEAIKAARNAENDQCRREVERLRARQESRFQAIIAKGIELSYTADQLNHIERYRNPVLESIFALTEEEFEENREAFVAAFERAKARHVEHLKNIAAYELLCGTDAESSE